MPIPTVNGVPDLGDLQPDWLSDDAWRVYQLRRAGATQKSIVDQTGLKLHRVQEYIAQIRVRYIKYRRRVIAMRPEDV